MTVAAETRQEGNAREFFALPADFEMPAMREIEWDLALGTASWTALVGGEQSHSCDALVSQPATHVTDTLSPLELFQQRIDELHDFALTYLRDHDVADGLATRIAHEVSRALRACRTGIPPRSGARKWSYGSIGPLLTVGTSRTAPN